MMQEIVAGQEEQKDYIDSWVHEIKVPLAASQLLLRSLEFDSLVWIIFQRII